MSDFLPHDVFIDVLTRLPIKNLIQCACVCKSWYSFLTNPNFINTHLNRSSTVNNNLLLVRSRSVDDANVVHYSLLRSENGVFSDYAELGLPLKSHRNPCLSITGICNGLVCLSDDLHNYQEELYLWNPSIQKTITLPPLRVTYQSHGSYTHSIGFGFDALADDYKVVRIVYLDVPNEFGPPPEIDIFSLSTGTWRNISHLGLSHIIHERAPQAYLNGTAYWLAFDRGIDFVNWIVSFHMGDEVFGEIMVPMLVPCSIAHDSLRVAKFRESLSLIVGFWSKGSCCIWVMNDYGVSKSWTKQFHIDMTGGLFNNVAGEILFGRKDGYLVAYYPQAEEVMPLHIRGSRDESSGDSFYADAYTESLVLLGAKVDGAKKLCKRRAKLAPLFYPKKFAVFCLSKKRRAKPRRKERRGL